LFALVGPGVRVGLAPDTDHTDVNRLLEALGDLLA